MNKLIARLNILYNKEWQHHHTPLIKWCVMAILFLLLWVWLIQPLQQWKGFLAEQLSRNAQKAVRLISLQKNAAAWVAAEKLAIAQLEQESKLLFWDNSDTASQANLQLLLKKQSLKRGLMVESQKLLPVELLEGIGTKLPIAINLKGSMAGVLLLLNDISQAGHIIQVQRWFIRKNKATDVVAKIIVTGYRGVASINGAKE